MAERRKWRLGFGADQVGAGLKSGLRDVLKGHPAIKDPCDSGVPDANTKGAYPSIALPVAETVARGAIDRAILTCGTGIGTAISANKVDAVRSTVAHNVYSVGRSVLSIDCQALAPGSNVVAISLAECIVNQWLNYLDDGSDHTHGFEQNPRSSWTVACDAYSAAQSIPSNACGVLALGPKVIAPRPASAEAPR